jgi:hypothetical protein
MPRPAWIDSETSQNFDILRSLDLSFWLLFFGAAAAEDPPFSQASRCTAGRRRLWEPHAWRLCWCWLQWHLTRKSRDSRKCRYVFRAVGRHTTTQIPFCRLWVWRAVYQAFVRCPMHVHGELSHAWEHLAFVCFAPSVMHDIFHGKIYHLWCRPCSVWCCVAWAYFFVIPRCARSGLLVQLCTDFFSP